MVDLDHLQMTYGQRNAIRQLTHTRSVKIGLQFKTAWWEKLNIVGGQSSTDRPIRDIVYPSYPHDDSHPGKQNSNCIIAAYSGMQNSQRLASLMKGKDSPEESVLLDLVMPCDLAAVHQVDIEMLWDQLEDYYPWDFYRDEFQLGNNYFPVFFLYDAVAGKPLFVARSADGRKSPGISNNGRDRPI